jgi:hypothetical protein
MEYDPVCAKIEIKEENKNNEPIEQTFSNRCMMDADKSATFLYK